MGMGHVQNIRGNAITTQADFGAFNQLPKLVKKAVLTDLEIEIIYLGVSLNGGFSPKSSILKWVFHYFHHPFEMGVFPLFLDFHPF